MSQTKRIKALLDDVRNTLDPEDLKAVEGTLREILNEAKPTVRTVEVTRPDPRDRQDIERLQGQLDGLLVQRDQLSQKVGRLSATVAELEGRTVSDVVTCKYRRLGCDATTHDEVVCETGRLVFECCAAVTHITALFALLTTNARRRATNAEVQEELDDTIERCGQAIGECIRRLIEGGAGDQWNDTIEAILSNAKNNANERS